MTEKQYSGSISRESKEISFRNKLQNLETKKIDNPKQERKNTEKKYSPEKIEGTEKILKAGKISKEIREYIKKIVKRDMPLLEIAEKVEAKIQQLGGKPAFPVNLSIDRIAAHYTPSHDDKTTARGLLKIDFGVHIDGFLVDNAISMDLENSKENKKLIEASEKALENALNLIKLKIVEEKNKVNANLKLSEIGKTIQETIEDYGFSPIINLSGHSIERYNLHSGITIPNIDDKKEKKLIEGIYAIEPFATTGSGRVHEAGNSGIYYLINKRQPRSDNARKVLKFISEEYKTLPFCSRWIFKKFGVAGLFALKEIESNGNLHHFPQLVESSNTNESKVSQSEHTILIQNGEFIVVTQ